MSARGDVRFRLSRPDEADRVRAFINNNFDWKLPLINIPEYFDYYYRSEGALHFALAEQGDDILAAAGYIPSDSSPQPDIWVSVWVAAAGHNGVGLSLMSHIRELTGARIVSCNNIRSKTMAFYRFLGWHADRIPHYYRLSKRQDYRLARVADTAALPVGGDLELTDVSCPSEMRALGLPPTPHTPRKDLWYLERRYFGFPGFAYNVRAAVSDGRLAAYLVSRVVDTDAGGPDNVRVLRIVDFIGDDSVLPRLGRSIDRLISESGAEYAECYCYGISAETFAAAGFRERAENSADIVPNYLTPPICENTEYYFFTSEPDGFVMFKADGDQDKPNLKID